MPLQKLLTILPIIKKTKPLELVTYTRAEKLKQKTEVNLLFEKGKWKSCDSLRVILLKTEQDAKLGVSVSKRYFKKAVDRNRIKRLLREVYRLNKAEFKAAFGPNYVAMLFWNNNRMPKNYDEVLQNYIKLCNSVTKKNNS